jgi:hypothetical protein
MRWKIGKRNAMNISVVSFFNLTKDIQNKLESGKRKYTGNLVSCLDFVRG